MTDTTDDNSDEAIAARLAALRAKRPDWYDAAPFRFENGLGEDWGARIRSEGGKTYVDLTGCDVGYEVRSVLVPSAFMREVRQEQIEVAKLVSLFRWVLGHDEIHFVVAVAAVARQRAQSR